MEDQEKSLKSEKDLIYLKTRMEACLEHISPKSLQFSSVQSLSRVQLFACQAPLSMEFSRPEYQNAQPFSLPGDLPNPGIEPRSPALQADSLLSEPPRKPRNTGVGSLSLHQQIFPTQESNWGLLHCRQILYQLSYHLANHNSEINCHRFHISV